MSAPVSTVLRLPGDIGHIAAHELQVIAVKAKVNRLTRTRITSAKEIRQFALSSFGVGHCCKLQRFKMNLS
eukprot:scaffold13382_cov25-Prasinocladus_malaysianus.AAC.1